MRGGFWSGPWIQNDLPLADDEMQMNYGVYNQIFNEDYTPQNLDTFVPHEVVFRYYTLCDRTMSVKKCEKTMKIVRLSNQVTYGNVSETLFHELRKIEAFPFGYYFDGADGQEGLLVNAADELGFIPNSSIGGSITTMTKAVGVFSDFFVLIFVVLCAALLLLMVQFELKNIRDKMREIGIMKALGARDLDLIIIFGFQILVAGLAMLLLYIAGSFVFIGLANRILVLSLNELASSSMVMDLSFLAVKWRYIWQNCLLALGILLVSFLAPMLRLRHIKPTNVIKAKE